MNSSQPRPRSLVRIAGAFALGITFTVAGFAAAQAQFRGGGMGGMGGGKAGMGGASRIPPTRVPAARSPAAEEETAVGVRRSTFRPARSARDTTPGRMT